MSIGFSVANLRLKNELRRKDKFYILLQIIIKI